ncbi:autotransporter-associated beta strand repeat-containing protein, partial [Stenotrophomonas sp. C3(2023)]|uniref:autotransporter-associated beta strand repeat-containing protein n=1 Tax=Stenotrophomonas sp. C3(2023) TaxID=3080277 RepID=UPI00293D0B86
MITTAANTILSNSGNVSGTGGLVKNGAGAMALTGTLAHAGGTTVNDGVMTLTGSNSYTGGTTL